jgi:hypothetical protein
MLQIRKAQNQEFKIAGMRDFEKRMVQHLCKYFPIQGEVLGDEQMLKVVQYGIAKAQSHGFKTERNMAVYLTLVPMLGSTFDADVQLPWTAEILNDENDTNNKSRVDRLAEKALEFHKLAIGQDSILVKTLIKHRGKSFEELLLPATGSFEEKVIVQMKGLYGEKYKAIGEDNTLRLIQHGRMEAEQFDIKTDGGVSVFIAMMYLMGSGFFRDPIYPWAAEVLNDKEITTEQERVDRLYEEATAFFDKWLVCMIANKD